jgi:glycosyltransferase involved in cell wall biosynthesis
MKIAILTPGGVDRSGTTRVIPCLLWFIERLVRSGDEVHVFALRQETARARWPLLGANVHNAGGRGAVIRGWRAALDLHREHRRAPFDVIHALWAVPQGALAAIGGKMLGVPVLLHLPGGDIVNLPKIGYGGRRTMKGRAALRMAVWGADRIVSASDDMVRRARELGIHAGRIPFGVALDHWPPLLPRRRADGAPARLLQVANLSAVKDQETLLLAAKSLRVRGIPFVLEIIGEDTLYGRVHLRTQALGLEDHVRFPGFLPQAALSEHVYAADLLVVTSRHEAGPVVVFEAAAAGVPTVGTKVGILADWAPEAARVVEIGDAEALGHAIAELLSNEDKRLQLAAEAQQRAINENADITTAKIRQVYLEMRRKP